MSFPAVNDNGAYYTKQDEGDGLGLDPFAAIGLHADAPGLTQRGAKLHARIALKHVYERQGLETVGTDQVSRVACGLTSGPRVPLWRHVNKAKGLLAVGDEATFQRLRRQWITRGSMQTWNPFAPHGSEEAKQPNPTRTIPHDYTIPEGADPPPATTTTATAPHPTRSVPTPAPPPSTARSVPKPAPPPSTARSAPLRPYFDVDLTGDFPTTTGRRSAGVPVARSPFLNNPPTVARSPVSIDPIVTPRRRAPRFDPTTASSHSGTPSSASRRRNEPRGVYLGNWNKSRLPANQSNAVYGSRDSLGRFNRRISLQHADGHRVDGGNYSIKSTACKHEDIDYIGQFRGMTKAQVEAAVSPLLEALPGSMESAAPSSASRRRRRVERSESPTPVRYGQQTARRRGIPIELDSDGEEVTASDRDEVTASNGEEETASKVLGENKSEEWENYEDFFNGKVPYA